MKIKKFTLNVNQETIAVAILSKIENFIPPNFIFFHGGAGNKERIYPIIPPVLDKSTNVLALDFSGHGESSGLIKKSSLKLRSVEAEAIIDHFIENNNELVICGASMGGYTAIKMLEIYNVKSLILFCPALYDKNAYEVQFDNGFTDIIRKPYSWRNTDALQLLENFEGNLLLIIGNKDEIIPSEVTNLIMRHTEKARKKELYTIPDCPHKIFNWLLDQEDILKKIQQKLLEYI